MPDIPGVEGDNVVLAEDVLAGRKEVGEDVVIVGGELVACDTALYLAEKGKLVTMCRRGPVMAEKLIPRLRAPLLDKLTRRGVVMLTGVRYDRITDRGLDILDGEGKRRTLEADNVVVAEGARPINELARNLEGIAAALYPVGDCIEPRMIREAIAEGARAGIEV
ncbi:FAD-dependent oxidoreductase [Chloroflexota bacterium]